MKKNPSLNRRQFLKTGVAGTGALSISSALTGCLDKPSGADQVLNIYVFGHGVASGDPLADSVIIWTRVTPDAESEATQGALVAKVNWRIATDPELQQVVASGEEYTSKNKDFTIKVDVKGLKPDTQYYYQFSSEGGAVSPLGQTKTLPVGQVNEVKLAACSCANFPAGLFHVYAEMAKSDVDAVLHLGDYIYEYGSNKYPSKDAKGRVPDPLTETISLDDYRRRYQQYRIDPDLQAVHAAKPFICIWDDHEITNDAYVTGAQNHDPSEGDYETRIQAAVQAYHEWLPIRTGENKKDIYRRFDFGDLVSLYMLETRLLARTKQLELWHFVKDEGYDTDALYQALRAKDRTLLGEAQKSQLFKDAKDSTATWQVLGQQLIMGRMELPTEYITQTQEVWRTLFAGGDIRPAQQKVKDRMAELVALKNKMESDSIQLSDEDSARITTKAPYNLDAWDGYMYERDQIIETIRKSQSNLIVLAGDTHNGWASELCLTDSNEPMAVEFATSSVSSPGMESYMGLGDELAQANFELGLVTLVDHLKYVNASQRGYIYVHFTPEKAECQWRYIDHVESKDYRVETKKRLQVINGNAKLQNPA